MKFVAARRRTNTPASSSVKPAARRETGALPNQIGIKVTVARSYAATLPESASVGLYFPGTARPHGNYETVPGIDCRDCQRQIGEFLFREMLVCLLRDFVGSMICWMFVTASAEPRAARSRSL